MADVKESAMSTASDCKWVRALDANGNSIRISKEDHARAVGGLLSSQKLYPFMDRGDVSDFNQATDAGTYKVDYKIFVRIRFGESWRRWRGISMPYI